MSHDQGYLLLVTGNIQLPASGVTACGATVIVDGATTDHEAINSALK
jgi:hypothetical protein